VADLLALRTTLRADQAALDPAQAKLDQLSAEADDPELPPAIRLALRGQVAAQGRVVQQLTQARDAAQAAYQAAVQADTMHGADPGLPLVLLPVRIETAYLPNQAGGFDLAVRIYPDDIHVDAHEPELAPAELAAATAYWKAVWGAGANQDRLDAAWREVLGKLKPARAAWSVQALTPSTPRPADETPLDQPQPEPPLPDVATRPGAFNRAARTTLLPDHWHVIGLTDGAERFHVEGSPIPDSLDVSFGPPGVGANDSDLPFDGSSRWLVDFDAAVAAGMAVRIPLDNPDAPIDQLFVLGVGAQVAPEDAAARLEGALLAHQFTNGLGFLPPGTPTNNTTSGRSAFSSTPAFPTPTQAQTLRAQYQADGVQNAALAARALGVDGATALSVADFGLEDQQTPAAVIQLQLWNALGGNSLFQLYNQWDIPPGKTPFDGGWHTHDSPDNTAMLKAQMLGWVRSRGTLPTLRVGNQPYGLLPASSLSDWATAADDPTTTLVTWLRTFRQYFLAAVASAPRIVVGGGQDPDSTVANVLQRLPVSQEIMVRHDGDPISQVVSDKPLPTAPIPGLPDNSALFLAAPDPTASRLLVPVVGDAQADHGLILSWSTLFDDSLTVLQGAMTSQDWMTKYQPIFGQKTFPGAPPPDLFTTLLQDSFNDPFAGSNGGIVGFIVLGACVFDQKKDDPAFQRLVQMRLADAQVFVEQFHEFLALDPATYDPVLREVLDVASHRFDAWVTSLAARRLDEMRAAKPGGVVIGAYGWVEDLSRRTDFAPADPLPAGFDGALSAPRQTYIHAPSLHHAATAAVLRSGFESHAHADTLAVNLESRRVRLGVWLSEGVNSGQTVGALLGYRFERGLHDAGQDSLIEGLRRQFPIPLLAGQDEGGADAREAIAARNVVDGLAIYRSQDEVRAQFPGNDVVGGLLDDLADVIDAFGDLLLAESVHHLVGGNPLRAGLAADTVGRGDPPPDRFDVARTPRAGRPLSWRLCALLPTAFRATVTGWRADRPRARIEPHAEAWAASMMGNAGLWRIDCNVASPGGASSVVSVTLDQLGLSALDVVCEMAGSTSILERRVIDAVSAGQPPGSVITVAAAPAADGTPGFAELGGLADRLRALLSQSTALGPNHVQGPDAPPTLGVDVPELSDRAVLLQTSLSAAVAELDDAAQAMAGVAGGPAAADLVNTARAKLIQLADLGVVSAYPVAGAPDDPAAFDAISAQAAAVLASARPQAASAAPLPPPDGSSGSAISSWLKATAGYVQGVMGKTVPILPSFLIPAGSDYAAAFAAAASPVGGDAPDVTAWLRRLGRVRPNAAALYDVLLANAALAGGEPDLTAAQLPVEPGARWIGLPFEGAPPPKARVGIVASTPTPIDPSAAFCGLLFDNWTEQLPGLSSVADPAKGYEAAEVTGLAFTVDGPDAYPPQAILLAVAPDPNAGWSLDILYDVVSETLDLAKMRTVDLGDLPRLGRVLPALHSGSSLDEVIGAAGAGP
jgi:hypothetical protein